MSVMQATPEEAHPVFTPLRSVAYVTLCIIASVLGWIWGMAGVPEGERRPPPPLPRDSLHTLARNAPAAAEAVDLRAWRFAQENGLDLQEFLGQGRIVFLPEGTQVRVEDGDLDLVRVIAPEMADAGPEFLWMAVEDVAPTTPANIEPGTDPK